MAAAAPMALGAEPGGLVGMADMSAPLPCRREAELEYDYAAEQAMHHPPALYESPPRSLLGPRLFPDPAMPSVIAFDCLGAEWYRVRQAPYTTPLVGSLFRSVQEFFKFCSNLPLYLSVPPMPCSQPKHAHWNGVWYPITTHSDVEIHWIHEASFESVLEKWNRRLQRFNWDRVVVMFADAWIPPDLDEAAVLHFFEQLPYRKVAYTRRAWDPQHFPSTEHVGRWEGAQLGDYSHMTHCSWYDRGHILEFESERRSDLWFPS